MIDKEKPASGIQDMINSSICAICAWGGFGEMCGKDDGTYDSPHVDNDFYRTKCLNNEFSQWETKR